MNAQLVDRLLAGKRVAGRTGGGHASEICGSPQGRIRAFSEIDAPARPSVGRAVSSLGLDAPWPQEVDAYRQWTPIDLSRVGKPTMLRAVAGERGASRGRRKMAARMGGILESGACNGSPS